MGPSELWTEAYQGEVLGEALFGALAEREADPGRRAHLELLTVLERSTKELAEPLLDRLGIERGDTEATLAGVAAMVDAVAAMTWDDFVASIEPVASRFLETYRRLVDLATDDGERAIAEAYVAHELALASFARRALGQEDGDPAEPVRALAHVAAAVGQSS
jgi:hypothetical protein